MDGVQNIPAIPTRYKGILFRSRLEARSAVFFDALGIPWDYEMQGFRLPSGNYLPDFWMPEQDCWIEIKGESPTEEEHTKGCELSRVTGKPVFIFCGGIRLPDGDKYPWAWPAYWISSPQEGLYDSDFPYHFCQCSQCKRFGIQFDGRSDRMKCKEPYCCAVARSNSAECKVHGSNFKKGCKRSGGNFDKGYSSDSAALIAAYSAAVSSRFEFGQEGPQ